MSELHDAAWKGDRAEVASLLLDAGADANVYTEEGVIRVWARVPS